MKRSSVLLSICAGLLILSACDTTGTPGETTTPAVSTPAPPSPTAPPRDTNTPAVSTPVPPSPTVPPRDTSTPAVSTPVPTLTSVPPGQLPNINPKPQPQEITFQGCPPEGDGGDPALNRLKNRVDTGQYVAVDFDAVEKLPWPKGIERRDRDKWSTADAAEVAKYEGIPISIDGYLFGAKESGPESTNCHGTANDQVDWHVWLTKTAGEDRTNSIVIETTPRVRKDHPGWVLKAANQIARNQQRVRISGWLMLDPEHPDQVSKTRGTIWEIHPIMQIEVQQGDQWIPLDEWQ